MNSYRAVKIGLILVCTSLFFFMILGLSIGIVLFNTYNFHIAYLLVFILCGTIIYWPFWSFLLVKWKIWSFNNVDDFKLFLELAEKRALIYPEGHFYSRNEFCSDKDKKILKELYSKRKRENVNDILFEKYSSKTILIWPGITRLFNNTPLLKISIRGLWFREIGLIEWNKFTIVNAKTTGGKYPSHWIVFKLRNKKTTSVYKLKNMNGTYLKLEYYLKTYKKIATINSTMSGLKDPASSRC